MEKRPGWGAGASFGTNGSQGRSIYNAIIVSSNTAVTLRTFVNGSVCEVYAGSTDCGDLSDPDNGITEMIVGNKNYWLFSCTDYTGWYLVSDAYSQTSYTGDIASGSAVITNIPSTAGMYSGQLISNANLNALTRIQSVDSATQITVTIAATGNSVGATLTKEPVAKIIDTDYPGNNYLTDVGLSTCGAFAVLDGYAFIMTINGRVYNSAINNPTSWSSADYISSDDYSDQGVGGVVRHGAFILAGGGATTEIFKNNGNPSFSPLSRLPGATLRVGIASFASAAMDGTTYWGSPPINGAPAIWAMAEGSLSPKQISTPEINSSIGGMTGVGGPSVCVGKLGGQGFVFVNVPQGSGNNYQYVYCVNAGIWVIWRSQMTAMANGFSTSLVQAPELSAVGNDGTGKGYSINGRSPVYTDNASSFSMIIQMARQDFGTGNRKFLKSIELVADTQASGTTTLEISKDDFATWTTIGTFDMTKAKKIIHRCGSFVGGASLRLTHSANTAWRGEALIVEYDVGAH
jgi:hypothetical protein